MSTFLWYDYEAHDADPMYARPASFAGIRTDMELNPIGVPINLLCRMANDFLPSPGAMLVHRLAPSRLQHAGIPEAEFARLIYEAKNQPHTINAGFNTSSFDVKIAHGMFYRSLLPMYGWHMNLNSRFDIHDVIRLIAAIDPSILVIPRREDGTQSFRLDDLATANNIPVGAHDALGDATATLTLAQRIKSAQPRIWDYLLHIRTKPIVLSELFQRPERVFLHVASYYGAERSYVAPVLPICTLPGEQNLVITVNLSGDFGQLRRLSSEALRTLLFTKKEQLPEGAVRPPVNQIKANASPVLIPLSGLSGPQLQNAGIDQTQCEASAQLLRETSGLRQKLIEMFDREPLQTGTDVDDQMYGGFPTRSDEAEIFRLLQLLPRQVAEMRPNFRDEKYRKLHGRFVARNYPELLSPESLARWDVLRRELIGGRAFRCGMTPTEFQVELERARVRANAAGDHNGLDLLAELEQYAANLVQPLTPAS